MLAQDMLLTEKGMSYRRLLDEWLAKDSLEVHPVLEAGQTDLICSLVEKGIGSSFLPDYVTEDALKRGTIKRLDAKGFYPDLWMQILYHWEKWVSSSIQAVLRIMTDRWL